MNGNCWKLGRGKRVLLSLAIIASAFAGLNWSDRARAEAPEVAGLLIGYDHLYNGKTWACLWPNARTSKSIIGRLFGGGCFKKQRFRQLRVRFFPAIAKGTLLRGFPPENILAKVDKPLNMVPIIPIDMELPSQHKRAIGLVIGISPNGFLLFEGQQYRVLLWGVIDIQPQGLKDLVGVKLYCSNFGPEPDDLSISAGCDLLEPVSSGVWYSPDGEGSIQKLLIRRNMAVENCDITFNTYQSCK